LYANEEGMQLASVIEVVFVKVVVMEVEVEVEVV
jgi:hypothetical protein